MYPISDQIINLFHLQSNLMINGHKKGGNYTWCVRNLGAPSEFEREILSSVILQARVWRRSIASSWRHVTLHEWFIFKLIEYGRDMKKISPHTSRKNFSANYSSVIFYFLLYWLLKVQTLSRTDFPLCMSQFSSHVTQIKMGRDNSLISIYILFFLKRLLYDSCEQIWKKKVQTLYNHHEKKEQSCGYKQLHYVM